EETVAIWGTKIHSAHKDLRRRSGRRESIAPHPCTVSGPSPSGSLVAVDDAPLRPVGWADLQQHAIVLDDADVVLRHPPGHPREHLVPVGESHGVKAVPA